MWQTDLTAEWCGEDGWGYLVPVVNCFCRSVLSWTFTLHCRTRDIPLSLEQAWSMARPYTPDEKPSVVLRQDNGSQFKSPLYRGIAQQPGVRLFRRAYRHADGDAGAFVERLYLSLKRGGVAGRVRELRAGLRNHEGPHQALNYRTAPDARATVAGSATKHMQPEVSSRDGHCGYDKLKSSFTPEPPRENWSVFG
jgi:transposase InsO family protein